MMSLWVLRIINLAQDLNKVKDKSYSQIKLTKIPEAFPRSVSS